MLVLPALPPGVWRNGTQYQARGRWYDTNLVRFYEETLRPWGGWSAFSASSVTGKARAAINWIDSSGLLWMLAGTESHLEVYDLSGALTDITPAGFTTGRADATNVGGYGGSTYGSSTYGNARGASVVTLPATVWTLDTLEQNPVACNADDGKIYTWDLVTAHVATQCSGSPISCRGVFVTQEGFIMALGAGGDPRKVQWPDQTSFTAWTPSDTNQAGSYALQTAGQIMCGLAFKGVSLIFTTTDVHTATYLGLPFIYSFNVAGLECGIISQAGYAAAEDFVAWMGVNSFWRYDGTVRAIESDIADYVFGRLNVQQRSKVWAIHNATYGEITWFYPSNAGSEIDSYALWNYRENHWTIGSLIRTCGVQAGVLTNPVMFDAASKPWSHEVAFAYNSEGTPYAETGPMEWDFNYGGDTLGGLHAGTDTFDIVAFVPDSLTVGDLTLNLYTRFYPTGAEVSWGPYTVANPTNVRVSGRESRLRLTAASAADFRIGAFRLDFRRAGER